MCSRPYEDKEAALAVILGAQDEAGIFENSREVQAQICARGVGLAVLPRPVGDAAVGLVALDIGEQPPGGDTSVGMSPTCGGCRGCGRCFIW
jgi:hypothetical protein